MSETESPYSVIAAGSLAWRKDGTRTDPRVTLSHMEVEMHAAGREKLVVCHAECSEASDWLNYKNYWESPESQTSGQRSFVI